MDIKKADNAPHGVRSIYLALYFLGAVLSGSGGVYAWLRTSSPEIVAPDRYTGTQAAALIRRVERLEKDTDHHLNQHPDITNRFDARLSALEAQYGLILQNQGRILDRLDSM